MPLTADQLQARIDTINNALASGVTEIVENGRSMRFDLKTMLSMRTEAEVQLRALVPPTPARTRRILTYSPTKGY